TASVGVSLMAAWGQGKLALKDLPAPAQKTIQETLKGGEIKAISREKEGGVTQYEVESMLNGKHRDFNVDTKGNLVEVEEETAIERIAPGARDAIVKKVGTGKISMVETLTEGGQTYYEAAYTTKAGKKAEVTVKPDGTTKK